MARNGIHSDTRRAIRDSIIAQAVGTLTMVLFQHGGIAALLIIALIGNHAEFEIGCAIFVMQWATLMRLLAAPHVDMTWRRRFLVRWGWVAAGWSCAFLLVPAVGALGAPRLAVWLFVGALALHFGSIQAGAAAWFPLLSYILPVQLRGRYFGSMRRAWQITGFGMVFVSGWLMRGNPGLFRFYLVLVPAVALQLLRVLMYARLPDPPPAKPRESGRFWRDLLRPVRDARFRPFLITVVSISLAQYAALPFVVPYIKTELGFPASVTLYATACVGAGSILSLRGWGRLADRWGNRVVFMLGIAITAAAFLLFASASDFRERGVVAFVHVAVGLFLAGAGTAGIGIAYTVRLLFIAPEQHAAPYMSAVQGGVGAVGGVIALLTGLVLSRAPVMFGPAYGTWAFRAFFVLVAVGLLGMLLRVRRLPRIAEPHLAEIVSSFVENLPLRRNSPDAFSRRLASITHLHYPAPPGAA